MGRIRLTQAQAERLMGRERLEEAARASMPAARERRPVCAVCGKVIRDTESARLLPPPPAHLGCAARKGETHG